MLKKMMLKKKISAKQVMISILILVLLLILGSFGFQKYQEYDETTNFIRIGNRPVEYPEFQFYYKVVTDQYLEDHTREGFDQNKSFEEQSYNDQLSWADYFQKLTVEEIQKVDWALDQIRTEKTEISVEHQVKEQLAELKNTASLQNLTLEYFLQYYYGEHVTEEGFRQYLTDYYTATEYFTQLEEQTKETLSLDQIEDYIDEHEDTFQTVSYRSFAFPYEEGQEKTAEDQANTFLEQINTEEDFQRLCLDYISEEERPAYEANPNYTVVHTQKQKLTGASKDWLTDTDRKNGDTTIIQNAEEKNYTVMYYLQSQQDVSPSVRIFYLQLPKSAEDIGQQAKAILEQWETTGKTEEEFLDLLETYHGQFDYTSHSYEYAIDQDLPEALSGWAFENRTEGDVEILEDEDAYYLVYFGGVTDLNATQVLARKQLLTEQQEALQKTIQEDFPVTDKNHRLKYLLF